MTNTCPFCGTDVKRGFEVCPGCGAEFSKPGEARFHALLFVAGGIALALFGLSEDNPVFLIVLLAVGALLAFVGVTKFKEAKNGVWKRVTLKR